MDNNNNTTTTTTTTNSSSEKTEIKTPQPIALSPALIEEFESSYRKEQLLSNKLSTDK